MTYSWSERKLFIEMSDLKGLKTSTKHNSRPVVSEVDAALEVASCCHVQELCSDTLFWGLF